MMKIITKGCLLRRCVHVFSQDNFASLNAVRNTDMKVCLCCILVNKLGVAAGLERRRFPWVGSSADAQH